jgi:hypothetical protein
MPEQVAVEFVNEAGNRRRVRFERRGAGGWDRTVEEFDDGEWRGVGGEIVANLQVAVDGAVLVEGNREDEEVPA